jgi:hypothetical protein
MVMMKYLRCQVPARLPIAYDFSNVRCGEREFRLVFPEIEQEQFRA